MRARTGAATFRRRPKAELHVHLEGAIGPALLGRLSGRPREAVLPLYRFTDFAGFLGSYAAICRSLSRPEPWRDVVIDLGRRLRRDGVIHAEVFFGAAVHQRHGIPYPDLVAALEDGAGHVEDSGGPSMLFMADGVRQWGIAALRRMVTAVLRHPSPRVVAVGLGGDETARPAADFAGALRPAREAGLALVIHSGEFGEPEEVRRALRSLRPDRLAHGVRAAGDAALLAEIRAQRVPLDVCLTSNRRTRAVSARGPGPLPTLLAAGVRCTLGTDDPALFRCSLSGEYARAAWLGLGASTLRGLAVEAARACLLPERGRKALIRRVAKGWPPRVGAE